MGTLDSVFLSVSSGCVFCPVHYTVIMLCTGSGGRWGEAEILGRDAENREQVFHLGPRVE